VQLENDELKMPRIDLPILWDCWARKLANGTFETEEMLGHFDIIYEEIQKTKSAGKCYWELVPANCFYDEKQDEILFFDQEYSSDGISADVAVCRAVLALRYSSVFNVDPRLDEWLETLKKRYNLAKDWHELVKIADTKTFNEVFGNGRAPLERIMGNLLAQIIEHANTEHYDQRFYPVIQKLRHLGFKRPAIYGFGSRGKALHKVFDDAKVEVAVIYDQKYQMTDSILSLITKNNADTVIVSMLDGDAVAAALRNQLPIPVYTLKELLDGQA
jgi:hypothetical protein